MKHSNGRVKFLPARRAGVHANAPYCRSLVKFKRVIGWSIVALAVALVVGYPLFILQVAANASVTPAAKTCAAFTKWDHARTAANLNAMLTDSEAAPWALLGTDAVVLYTDVRDHDTTDAKDDILYFGQDCRKR
jgi:hypothetical protein